MHEPGHNHLVYVQLDKQYMEETYFSNHCGILNLQVLHVYVIPILMQRYGTSVSNDPSYISSILTANVYINYGRA